MQSNSKTYQLFEYGQSKDVGNKTYEGLEVFLEDLWEKRDRSSLNIWEEEESFKKSAQQFLQFSRKHTTIRSNNFAGIIRYDDTTIHLLPKIFDTKNEKEYETREIEAIQSHILWWLSYCQRFKFPKAKSGYNSLKSNFFEVLIYLFASYTRTILYSFTYQGYDEIDNEVYHMRGRLNVNKYINQNLATGNWQRLQCIYDSFEIDNLFNRIIKYVSKLLLAFSQNAENKKLLREIVFILDEVQDIQASIYDCEKVKLNPIFQEMFTILDYCKLFLANSTVLTYKNDFKVFAFLLPMEYVFEDFIYGFIDQELNDVKVKAQSSEKKLTEENRFTLKPDLVIDAGNGNSKIIADTKYKLIYEDDPENNYGVMQSDMYQMVSYAIRHKATHVKLLYPNNVNHINTSPTPVARHEVKDEFSVEKDLINIDVYRLPIIGSEWNEIDTTEKLKRIFEKQRGILKKFIEKILMI